MIQKLFHFLNNKKKQRHLKKQFNLFRSLSKKNAPRFTLEWKNRIPCLNDNTETTHFDHHYIYHTAWAIRKLKQINPEVHHDFASSLYFSSLASAFFKIHFYDYRPAKIKLDNLKPEATDITQLQLKDNHIESLSCMHVIEHIGLGRYGDPLDPDGDLKAIAELKRVLKPKGSLLFVVPIGKPVICYNAHRIYAYKQIIEYFSGFQLKEFSLIPDDPNSGIIENASEETANKQNYGCGCFWLIKQ